MFRVVVKPYGADNYGIGIASLADIKAILETYWSERYARNAYFNRHRLLWDAKGSDSYSYVYSGMREEVIASERVIVRNGEAVEAFYTEDFEEGGVVYPAGTRIEANNTPTLEKFFWYYAEVWGSGIASAITDVTFDYEFGYPSAFTLDFAEEGKWFFYASDYTPLDNYDSHKTSLISKMVLSPVSLSPPRERLYVTARLFLTHRYGIARGAQQAQSLPRT